MLLNVVQNQLLEISNLTVFTESSGFNLQNNLVRGRKNNFYLLHLNTHAFIFIQTTLETVFLNLDSKLKIPSNSNQIAANASF